MSVDLEIYRYQPKLKIYKPKLQMYKPVNKHLHKKNKYINWLQLPSQRKQYIKTKPTKCKISAALKRQVWETYIGKQYTGLCFCCKRTEINVFDFQNGHVVAEAKGGETNLNNLRPICALCNYSSGTHNMMEFAQKMGFL